MPLSEFQKYVLKLLAAQRSQESYIAGGAPIAASTSRYSGDFDIFHDREDFVSKAAAADAELLSKHGLSIRWIRKGTGIWSGEVEGGPQPLKLEWAHDAGFRFFPSQADDEFGFVLHPADLITNKALTIADRQEARDVYDIVSLSSIVPIAAAIIAAPAKDPGYTPESLIAAMKRNIAHPQVAFDRLRSDAPIDGGGLLRTLRQSLAVAADLAMALPDEAIGKLYFEDGEIVVPDPARLGSYETREAQYQAVLAQPEDLPFDTLAQKYGKNQ
ncbi:hypothetical protein HJG53_13930 [Sphingomonas sp. ID1715]|uniref:hypothetical protein n=1 Tax=Sphingomonas sp. ID1715 TaxID=1656898 RepID=UPI001489F804|nr:hypothetical protein [Sphingomonas sp. ID1715]NNM78001.1 hypothetical protein [Sphingomonas sp. ID1715]